MVYRRILEDEIYTAAFNFSPHEIKLNKKIMGFLSGKIIISSVDRKELKGVLLPWEGVLINNPAS
jgi:hypothetical protein